MRALCLIRRDPRATDAFLAEGEAERRRALLNEMLSAADRGAMSWDEDEVRSGPHSVQNKPYRVYFHSKAQFKGVSLHAFLHYS